MNGRLKWTVFQVLSTLLLITVFVFLNRFMEDFGTPVNDNRTIYLIAGMLFILVTCVYIISYFQLKKYPNLMKHKVWNIMPKVMIVISVVSFVLFIVLAVGPLVEWLEQWMGLLYMMMTYFVALFFFFIMSVIHKLSDSKENVLYQTYFWTLSVLLVAIFLL